MHARTHAHTHTHTHTCTQIHTQHRERLTLVEQDNDFAEVFSKSDILKAVVLNLYHQPKLSSSRFTKWQERRTVFLRRDKNKVRSKQ